MYPKPLKLEGRKTYYFFYSDNGRRRKKNTGCTNKGRAQTFIKEFIDARSSGINKTLRQYAQPFLSWETSPRVKRLISEGKTCGELYARDVGSRIEDYILTDPIADKMMRDITTGDVIDFRTRLFAKLPDKKNTANKTLQTLKIVLGEAALRQDIPSNPASGVGKINYTTERREILTAQEIADLFAVPWKNQLAYQVFRFAAFTGMRRSEILALHWEQIQDGFCTVDRAWKDRQTIGTTKTGETRVIPLAQSVLDNLPERTHDLVFHIKGNRLGETWWRKNWQNVSDTKPHALRHALNSHLLSAGITPQFIQAYLGWSQSSLTRVQQGYTHNDPHALKVISSTIDQMYCTDEKIIQIKRG